MTARPTTLKHADRFCLRAVDHYENDTPMSRDVFTQGTAAHDVLHALGVTGPEVVDAVVDALMTVGREGVDSEPPLAADGVFAGRDLALDYYHRVAHGELGTDLAKFEVGLAVREDWSRCRYDDPEAWLRARLDVLDLVEDEDEEYYAAGIIVRDYKTAWSACETDLQSVQMKSQAVLASLSIGTLAEQGYPEPQFVRREIVNLRLGQSYHEDTWLDDEGHATLDQWRKDIDTAVRAQSVKPRQATPGLRCYGCSYVTRCEDSAAFVLDTSSGVAERYAAALAYAKGLEPHARAASDGGAIEVEGGRVGTIDRPKKEPESDVLVAAWTKWLGEEEIGEKAKGLVRRFLGDLRPGMTQLDRAARLIFPDRKQKAERDAWAEQFVNSKPGRRFGVWR